MKLLSLLSSRNFISCNKYIAKEVGLTGSAVIGELCYLQSCFGPDFYHNQEEFVDTLCISMRQFKKTIENLKELGYITVVKKGIPCRNHYTVNEAKIVEVLEKYEAIIEEECRKNREKSEQDSACSSSISVASSHNSNPTANTLRADINNNINKNLKNNKISSAVADEKKEIPSELLDKSTDLSWMNDTEIESKTDDSTKTKRRPKKSKEVTPHSLVKGHYKELRQKLFDNKMVSSPFDTMNGVVINQRLGYLLDDVGMSVDDINKTFDYMTTIEFVVKDMKFNFQACLKENVFMRAYNEMKSNETLPVPPSVSIKKARKLCPVCGEELGGFGCWNCNL